MKCPQCCSERVRRNKLYYLRDGTVKRCLTCMNCGKSHSVVVSKVISESYVGDKRYAEIIEALGSRCQSCGTTKNLEIHHKIPLSIKRLQFVSRYNSWKNIENLQLLCKRCHKHKHRKHKLTVHKGLTEEDVKEMKRLYANGMTQRELAEKFRVATSTIRYHLRKASENLKMREMS